MPATTIEAIFPVNNLRNNTKQSERYNLMSVKTNKMIMPGELLNLDRLTESNSIDRRVELQPLATATTSRHHPRKYSSLQQHNKSGHPYKQQGQFHQNNGH